MQNKDIDIKNYTFGDTKSTMDYILLIRTNLKSLTVISLIIFILFLSYALLAPSIYKSTVTLKITVQQKTVLNSGTQDEVNTAYSDRFIANEIEVIQNYDTREKVAYAIIDSIENNRDKSIFILMGLKENTNEITGHKTLTDIITLLKTKVKTEQIVGMDVIDISAESPSPKEAALIANTYAEQYKKLNLEENRNQLNVVRKFLEKQTQDKLSELNKAENELTRFKEKGGIVALDAQSSILITQLSQLDAERDAAKIDLMTSNGVLDQYKKEIGRQDPILVNYLEGQTSQAYVDVLQKQIADLQMNRDMAMTNKSSDIDVSGKIKDYDRKISDLQQKLNSKINEIKTGAFSSSPNQIRDLTQKLIEEEVRNHSLSIKLNELQTIIDKYEVNLNKLPKKSMDFAGYERNMESLQQLYTLVQQKYQEAFINELSQPGNSTIIGIGRVPDSPAKPNRLLIILLGILAGPVIAFGYILIKDAFDDTVQTPDDIEKNNISFLSWVPHSIYNINNYHKNEELLALYESDSPVSESFRTIKARIQTFREDSEFPKVILVTSPAEGEGKSFVSFNLAGNFAQSNKRTLLIDCDLRRPKIHTILGVDKKPGLVDYLSNKVKLEDIIRKTRKNNLSFITSGPIPLNPAELLESKLMRTFLDKVRDIFDVIIFDSAPIVAVIDTEIVAKLVDGTILVISAAKTKNQLMLDAVKIIKRNNSLFLGIILNNFIYKNGYGYYFKYYYNYSSEGKGIKKHRV
ncbi:MAG: polysaccharide biosynthesis tyrosine autokinase [Ignavibacteriaceae bacterium]|nr:polysaccharide biosynthesis tyrosine autokinase [Ignavibacteriaceae bacterium]